MAKLRLILYLMCVSLFTGCASCVPMNSVQQAVYESTLYSARFQGGHRFTRIAEMLCEGKTYNDAFEIATKEWEATGKVDGTRRAADQTRAGNVLILNGGSGSFYQGSERIFEIRR